MTDSRILAFVVDALVRATSLGRPAARAAVRSVLAKACFEPASVSAGQMQLVIERLLPAMIRKLDVEDAEQICRQLAVEFAAQGLTGDGHESPDEIFGRMIRR